MTQIVSKNKIYYAPEAERIWLIIKFHFCTSSASAFIDLGFSIFCTETGECISFWIAYLCFTHMLHVFIFIPAFSTAAVNLMHFHLIFKVFLCFGNSVASTRFLLQDEFNIQTTQCDNCIIVCTISSVSHFLSIIPCSLYSCVLKSFRVLCSVYNK